MDKTVQRGLAAGAAIVGAALVGGAIYYFREKATPGPDYRVLVTDGDFEVRAYPEIIVAEVMIEGARKEALGQGFRALADYIFAKSRDGEELPMTVPVLQDSGQATSADGLMFDDTAEGRWRVRFVMPEGRQPDDLPEPPPGIELVEVPARRVAAVKFSGVADDDRLIEQEDLLRGWLQRRSEEAGQEPEYAFYNSPMIPPPLRRSEVLLPLD
jgi:DNA gyrase inhibitor GyrI